MTASSSAPARASGPLLLSDISGYTSFLQSVAAAHRDDAFADGAIPDAYALITEGAVDRFGVPTDGSVEIVELYEHYAPLRGRVYPLRAH